MIIRYINPAPHNTLNYSSCNISASPHSSPHLGGSLKKRKKVKNKKPIYFTFKDLLVLGRTSEKTFGLRTHIDDFIRKFNIGRLLKHAQRRVQISRARMLDGVYGVLWCPGIGGIITHWSLMKWWYTDTLGKWIIIGWSKLKWLVKFL